MKLFLTIVTSVPVCAGLMLAQTASGPSSTTQSWTGLLVAAGCQNSAMTPDTSRSTVMENGMAKNTPGSKTERNTTYEDSLNQADRSAASSDRPGARKTPASNEGPSDMKNSTPETANTNASNMAVNDGSMDAERVVATHKSCQISNQTASFALRLRDGRLIPFDDASNSKIASQLQSTNRLGDKTKVFRVVVKGALQSDRISLDSIKI